ncbi:endonuclease/exonuclease/phosphatase family protein [Dysgonomonas gadei]|uniref:Endonuclease/exonuclease/phosphatase domain-containing protein n=1 Tax=Dysgonomonas gadei ATCC BAA-286 TaxID=742766 RepID=F5IZI1_9BACT|nr:endonuclease/exonuclease/phosphatase family protein [Dysgonomonas gadei]EGK01306.1 hypothetical protein HMPREF9455_02498 [Dysgonomonas gadei ATCC BAA-286]
MSRIFSLIYKIVLTFSLLILFLSNTYCSKTSKPDPDTDDKENVTELTVLQLNIWVECTKVPNAVQALTDQIIGLKPDVATFCELYKGDADDPVMPKLIAELKKNNIHYYSARIDGRAIISKYPIIEQQRVNKWQFKAVLNVDGRRVAVYPAHSEYRYYTCYYPRGYNDGSKNWNKLKAPITDVDTMLEVCNLSGRIESAQDFINDARTEISKGALVIYAGDFNEPSHLDWQAGTANMFGHNGCIVNWGVSSLLYRNGFKDAYREIHPDVINYPGFTFPANNKDIEPDAITWVPDADERERIDFVYYYPDKHLVVKKAELFGPKGCIVKGKRDKEVAKDPIILPFNNHWPSDHKGVLITFEVKK